MSRHHMKKPKKHFSPSTGYWTSTPARPQRVLNVSKALPLIDDGRSFLTGLNRIVRILFLLVFPLTLVASAVAQTASLIGKEISVPQHLQDGQEFLAVSARPHCFRKRRSFRRDGHPGRSRASAQQRDGNPLSDPTSPLVFPRNFDRLSGPDSNSCVGCHNTPFAGGGGDRVSEVFVLGQRFDFLDFDHTDTNPTKGAVDEMGNFVTMETAFEREEDDWDEWFGLHRDAGPADDRRPSGRA